jgi:hypothetical protein
MLLFGKIVLWNVVFGNHQSFDAAQRAAEAELTVNEVGLAW